MKRLITPKVCARLLGVSKSTVYKHLADGVLPHFKVGAKKGLRIAVEDVENFLAARRQEGVEIDDGPLKHFS